MSGRNVDRVVTCPTHPAPHQLMLLAGNAQWAMGIKDRPYWPKPPQIFLLTFFPVVTHNGKHKFNCSFPPINCPHCQTCQGCYPLHQHCSHSQTQPCWFHWLRLKLTYGRFWVYAPWSGDSNSDPHAYDQECHGRTTLYVTHVSIIDRLFPPFLVYHVVHHMDYHRDHFHSFVISSHPRALCTITCTTTWSLFLLYPSTTFYY